MNFLGNYFSAHGATFSRRPITLKRGKWSSLGFARIRRLQSVLDCRIDDGCLIDDIWQPETLLVASIIPTSSRHSLYYEVELKLHPNKAAVNT